VVSFPHWEQVVLVSERMGVVLPPPPSARLALQLLHLFGSFLNPLSAKNICSPAVKTNSAPHSAHFRTLSWYSMSRIPLTPSLAGAGWISHCGPDMEGKPVVRGYRAGVPWACGREAASETQTHLPYRGLNRGSAAPSRGKLRRLIRFPPLLFAQSLPRKRFFGPALLAGLHVEAVLLDFLDDVFLLHLALETTQGIFQGFTLLDNDFGHFCDSPPIRFGLATCGAASYYEHRPCSLSHAYRFAVTLANTCSRDARLLRGNDS
jgi:hypothetical protein